MSPKKKTQKASTGFSAAEKAAMKETLRERKMAGDKEAGKQALLAAIAKMVEPDRSMAKRIHAIVTASAPDLAPKTWYGMPAYAKDDKVICFFQDAAKFKARYATLGFSDSAQLDEGEMWPTSFALMELNPAVEAKIIALVKKAVS
jgi:uncharacterized protein YdhG (YjbR/CyaY superfamily)